jgi:hypothetical protein
MPRTTIHRISDEMPHRMQVAMTAAQRERQDLQCDWLRMAIAAQERNPAMSIDPESLRLTRPMEHDTCAH